MVTFGFLSLSACLNAALNCTGEKIKKLKKESEGGRVEWYGDWPNWGRHACDASSRELSDELGRPLLSFNGQHLDIDLITLQKVQDHLRCFAATQ